MEEVREREEILRFLKVDEYPNGYGYGYGSGDGCVDGYGYGSGDGSGYGYDFGSGDGAGEGSGDGTGEGAGEGAGDGAGEGTGDGSGDGYGYGDGSHIKSINRQKVHIIDGVATLIDSVHGNYAKGRILSDDLTTRPCFIAKCGNYFAHGETLKEAYEDVVGKYEQNMSLEERIRKFNEQYPDRDKKIPAKELFIWHHTLTGSCKMGRINFCQEHNLDYENGEYTVNEFIELTKDAYGGDVIRQLADSHG